MTVTYYQKVFCQPHRNNCNLGTAYGRCVMNPEEISRQHGASVVIVRFVAYLIDIFLVLVIPSGVPFLLRGIYGGKVIGENYNFLILLAFAFSGLYFMVMEGLTGATIGKFICKIRVVTAEGKTPGLLKAFLRSLIKVFESYILNPIGFFAAMVSKKHQTIGDMAAGTYVLRVKDLTEPLSIHLLKKFISGLMVLCLAGIGAFDIYAMTRQRYDVFATPTPKKKDFIVSKDKQSELKLLPGWSDSFFFNTDEAQITAENYKDDLYFVTYSYKKSELNEDVTMKDIYGAIIKKKVMKHKKQVHSLEVNGYPGIQIETVVKKDLWEEEPYVITVVETDKHFHLLVAWADHNSEGVIEKLKKVVMGFKVRESGI